MNTHLSFFEIRDFTAGLWTVGDWLMPPTAAQQMTDCYPVPSGGLRAWFKPVALTQTGITNISASAVIGLFCRAAPGSIGNATDYYLMTVDLTANNTRLFRMNTAVGETTWTLKNTFAAAVGVVPNATTWAVYRPTTGNPLIIMSLFGTTTDDGVWSFDTVTGVMTHLTNTVSGDGLIGPVAVHQSRIVAGTAKGNIGFTGPGDTTFGQNLATKEPSRDYSFVSWITPYSPGDLLIATTGNAFFMIEGDLTNYTLRTMGDSRTVGPIQQPAFGPMGPIYLASSDGIYETMDGSIHNRLTDALSSSTWAVQSTSFDGAGDVSFGNVAYGQHWVMGPHGLIMDYETKAWFQSSFLAPSAHDSFHVTYDRLRDHFVAAQGHKNFLVYDFDVTETGSRAESYTWKSAPLRDPTSRQVEIREVQVFAQTFNGATSSISVTVNGDTRTLSVNDPSGRDMLAFLFKQRGETLDVTVTAASNQTGVEAPTIEVVRIGTHPGHQTY